MTGSIVRLGHARHIHIPVPAFIPDGDEAVVFEIRDHDREIKMRERSMGVECKTVFPLLVGQFIDKAVHIRRVRFPDR